MWKMKSSHPETALHCFHVSEYRMPRLLKRGFTFKDYSRFEAEPAPLTVFRTFGKK